MCGRFALSHKELQKMLQEMGVIFPSEMSFDPRYNIAPGHKHWMLWKKEGDLFATQGVWGISPSWMKPGQLLFNAKIETVTEKPTFKKAFSLHRCVIPINGFYEWVQEGKIKQPYFFHRLHEDVFFLAGIYYVQKDTHHFVVMTTQANSWMQAYHHRMPIVLTQRNYASWLSATTALDPSPFMDTQVLLKQRKVSTQVNSAKVDEPSNIAPLDS